MLFWLIDNRHMDKEYDHHYKATQKNRNEWCAVYLLSKSVSYCTNAKDLSYNTEVNVQAMKKSRPKQKKKKFIHPQKKSA